ncbi:Yar1 protein [Saccharomycopsis crataegensis]|uniref:Yar1 protein n=1 Tax=Saccharomycopsis crataegensis TaxID=43959 RepID=A0AAV5QTZ4_9ASCO|nr:Yar1 protein [Saccharomycopsis crataegensis]
MVQESLTAEEIEYIVEEARYGELESLQQIFQEIDHKLLLNIKDNVTGSTLIHMSAGNGYLEVVKFLLSLCDSKIDKEELKNFVNLKNASGNTALHWAALNGHLEIVKVLCDEYEADPFVKNDVGHDAIFEAENNNKEDVEEYFLQKFSFDPEESDGDEDEDAEHKSKDEPTFKAGCEIESVTKEAIAAKEELLKERQQQEELAAKTEDLKI